MVYRGKPSTACELCRQKRRKCDKRHPGCGQCVRAEVPCPGYRVMPGLAIHDETSNVIRKVATSTARKSEPSRNESDKASPSSPRLYHISRHMYPSPEAVPAQLSLHLSHIAVTYFITKYAGCGQFYYVPDLVPPDILTQATILSLTEKEETSSTLALSLLACSLAVFSLTLPSSLSTLRPIAYKVYTAAIASLNAALASPASSVQDDTLISALLLGLFEAVLFRGRASPTSWTAHTQGALALLKLRGPQQCKSPLGRELFLHAATNIRVSCAQRTVPMPEALSELQDQAVSCRWLDPRRDLGVRMSPAIERMGDLRVEIAALGGFEATRARSTVGKALALENDVLGIITDVENSETVPRPTRGPGSGAGTPLSDSAFAGRMPLRVWSNPRYARSWTILQVMRLISNAWGYKCLTDSTRCFCDGQEDSLDRFGEGHVKCLPEEQEQQLLETFLSRGKEAIGAILDAVPYFTGSSPHKEPNPSSRYLIWPLSVVAVSPFATEHVQGRAVKHLYEIGRQFGLEQAGQAAKMVEDTQDVEDWLHIQYLS